MLFIKYKCHKNFLLEGKVCVEKPLGGRDWVSENKKTNETNFSGERWTEIWGGRMIRAEGRREIENNGGRPSRWRGIRGTRLWNGIPDSMGFGPFQGCWVLAHALTPFFIFPSHQLCLLYLTVLCEIKIWEGKSRNGGWIPHLAQHREEKDTIGGKMEVISKGPYRGSDSQLAVTTGM